MTLYICKIKEESESMTIDKHSTLLHNDVMVSYSTVQTSAYIIDQSLDEGILSHNYY